MCEKGLPRTKGSFPLRRVSAAAASAASGWPLWFLGEERRRDKGCGSPLPRTRGCLLKATSLLSPSTPTAVDFVRSSRPYRSTEQSVPFSLSTLSGLFFSPLPLSCSSLLLWPSLPSPLVYVRPLRRSSCCCCRVSSFSRSWDGGRRRRCGIFSMHASYL